MFIDSTWLELVIFTEIALVGAIIILTFFLKFLAYLKSRRSKRIEHEIEIYLSKLVDSNEQLNTQFFRWRWKRLDLLMLSLSKLDQSLENSSWKNLKENLLTQIMLPIARKKSNSRRSTSRFLAANCFSLLMQEQDEEIICNLMKDKTPIVHLHAIIAAVKFGSPTTINASINAMSDQRRLGQAIYLKIFEMASPQINSIIETRIKAEHDPYILVICYKILMLFPPKPSTINTQSDLKSDNLELQLAVIRFEAYTKKEKSVQLLTNMLANSHWEIRAACCKLLGDLHASEAIMNLSECLHDDVWWVRVNAANALKEFGEEGIQILRAQNPTDDLYAYETAVYVLNVPS